MRLARGRDRGRLIEELRRGFTIVELLIVIVVIAILATIAVVAYSGVQNKTLDAVRAHDMASIQKALMSYDAVYEGVPRVSSYNTGSGFGGWDVSTHSSWLSFLANEMGGSVPVDPKNIVVSTVDPSSVGNFVYRYFCYNAGHASAYPDSAAAVIGYRDTSNQYRTIKFRVVQCLL